ncbi:MAG TPA: FtsQ-type POTRA domain-containing protein [Pyrinomonadaceae bacterium]|nr:FtsQ-type POTRA domain-containing protein [Pyrinomonadaceae bacterium]
MREQSIASRGSRRSSAATREFVQRPARRDGREAGRSKSFSPRALFGYVPLALKVVLAILALMAAFIGYRVAASAAMFQVASIDVTGTSRTSAEEIEGLTRRAVARTGVWRADLSAISAELGRLPGVRRAIVSRVLPDRLRVRVTERIPVAVVHLSNGHFVWVDDEGVALGEMKPADRMPSFFIRGWNEEGTEDARKENAERVQKYQEATREWEAARLAERVSEINLIDVRDVRAQLAGNDSQIEVRLGGKDLGRRLKVELEALDEYKQTPRGSSITYVDLQGDRVIVGFSSGGKVSTGAETTDPRSDNSAAASAPKANARTSSSDSSNKKTAAKDSTNANRQKPARNDETRAPKPGLRLR